MLVRCFALVALGVVLMLVAHLFAFVGSIASAGHAWRTPYWLGYLLLYPAAGATIARVTRGGWMAVAICLCAAPVLYFASHAIVDGAWLASDGALWGALLALAVTATAAYFAGKAARQSSQSA